MQNIIVSFYYENVFKLILSVLIISALLFVINQFCKAINEHVNKIWRIVLTTLLIFSAFTICFLTLYNRPAGQTTVILIPFYSYYLGFNGNSDIWRECLMNVLLFYPIGLELMLLGLTKKKTLLIVASFSVLIEIIQGVFHIGTVELDDVIHNMVGVLFAVFIFSLFRCLWFNMIGEVNNNYDGKRNRKI